MNERIRKFERESHIDVYALGKDRDKWEKILSKFAELIVRDCIAIVNNHKMRMDSGPTHIIEDIKQHFGVEE